jgi:hypothetical protein
MRRTTLAAAAFLALAAPTAQAQSPSTDIATLLQSVENCLAWMNQGFPTDRTPFAGGFEVVEPVSDGRSGIYREAGTGFEITLTAEGDTAMCESTSGTVELGQDGLGLLENQLADRIEDGRAVRIAADRYGFCAGPPGLLSVNDAEEGATFLIEFNTDAALEEAGGCG